MANISRLLLEAVPGVLLFKVKKSVSRQQNSIIYSILYVALAMLNDTFGCSFLTFDLQ